MKLTRGALSFLLAEYRSIFKKAYIKGLASAVVLTAGLAAGQANAVDLSSGTVSSDIVITGDVNDASGASTGRYEKITVSGGNTLNTEAWDVLISSGAASTTGNYVSGDSNSGKAEWSGTGTLTINIQNSNDLSGSGLLIGTSGSLTMDEISIASGALILSGGGTAKVSASTLTIGVSGAGYSSGASSTAFLIINSGDTVDVSNDGSGSLVVNGGGQLLVNNQNAPTSGSVTADFLEINGGRVMFSGSSSSAAGVLNLNVKGGLMTSGLFDVTSGNTVNLNISGGLANEDESDFVFSGGYLNVAGTLNLTNSGSSSDVTVDMSSDALSIISVSGSTTGTTSGNQDFNSAGKIVVQGSENKLTLLISSGNLSEFLTGSASGGGIANSASGAVLISGSNSVLEFSDETVNLNSFYWDSGASTAGTIGISGGTVKGKEIVISSTLKKSEGASGTFIGTIEADNLTVSGSITAIIGDGSSTQGILGSASSGSMNLIVSNSLVLEADSFSINNAGSTVTLGVHGIKSLSQIHL